MDFFHFLGAITKWDEERVKAHKFPVLAALKYLWYTGLFLGYTYILITLSYTDGHFRGYWKRLDEEKLQREQDKLEQERARALKGK